MPIVSVYAANASNGHVEAGWGTANLIILLQAKQ